MSPTSYQTAPPRVFMITTASSGVNFLRLGLAWVHDFCGVFRSFFVLPNWKVYAAGGFVFVGVDAVGAGGRCGVNTGGTGRCLRVVKEVHFFRRSNLRGMLSFAPAGLGVLRCPTHGLRRGLHSCAAPRLVAFFLSTQPVMAFSDCS